MGIITYFLGQDEVPDVYVPVANLVPSDDGCGVFRYSISGDPSGIFHIKDDTLFVKKVPPFGTHDIDIHLNDPLNRFPAISNSFSLSVAQHYCATDLPTTTTTSTSTTPNPNVPDPSANFLTMQCLQRFDKCGAGTFSIDSTACGTADDRYSNLLNEQSEYIIYEIQRYESGSWIDAGFFGSVFLFNYWDKTCSNRCTDTPCGWNIFRFRTAAYNALLGFVGYSNWVEIDPVYCECI